MRDRLIIYNDDGIQRLHHGAPGRVDESIRSWVDFFLQQCHVDVFAFCTAFPDKTPHETTVGEREVQTAGPVRALVDWSQAKRPTKRLLGVPPSLAERPGLGLDPETWIRAS